MSRYRPARVVACTVLAIVVLPLSLSCSRKPAPAVGEQPEPDRPAPDGPAARRDQTIADQSEEIRLHPEKVNDRGELPHYVRGRAYADNGEHDRAIADFTEAIRLYPLTKGPYLLARLAEAYFARGESYRTVRDYDRAIADFTRVIDSTYLAGADAGEVLAFGGFRATAYYKRGVCYDERGDHGKAVADLKEAVRLGPDLANNEDLKQRMNK